MTVAASALAGTPVAVSDSRLRAVASTCAFWGVCLWLLVMPFEATRPLLRLPGQSISSAEAALFLVFAGFAFALFAQFGSGRRPATLLRWVRSLVHSAFAFPWIAFLVAVTASALAASADRTNAVHMAARFALAFGVFLVTLSGVTSLERLERVFVVAIVSGAIVSVLAALEFAGVPAVLRMLTAFRPGIFVVGAQVRAAGPFQYPTIASMYLEILFAFGVALLLMTLDRGRLGMTVCVATALILISEAVVLTFTRSGLITMGATLFVIGLSRVRAMRAAGRPARRRSPGVVGDRALWAIAVTAVVIGVELLSSRSADAVRLRMVTEEQDDWFHATVDAPSSVSLTTGATTTVPVTLTNTGLATWDSSGPSPVRLAYHWLLPDADRSVDFEGLRTDFAERVPPGDSIAMRARVRAPRQPGRYRLMWDVVEEGRLWFSSERDAELFTTEATVTGGATGSIGAARALLLPKGPARPGRFKLWRAALRMWLEHPLLGVGPDNFRLLYGPYAQISNADPRVHSNDMYVEILVDAGLVGLIAFAWVGWRVLGVLQRLVRNARGESVMLAAGLTAAVLAIAIHGVVDSFFSFTATYVLFALTLGLVAGADKLVSVHAHRV